MESEVITESDFQQRIDDALESGQLEEDDLLKFAVDYTSNKIVVFRNESPSEFLLQFDGLDFEPSEDFEPEHSPEPERIGEAPESPSEPLSGEPEPPEEPAPPEA